MSSNVDPLIVGRVIGDVVNMFEPCVTMAVYYDSKHVTNGCRFSLISRGVPMLLEEVLAYMGPRPPVGIHRYILVLFRQQRALGFLEPPMSRANFKTRDFAEKMDLEGPVAVVYYNANKEPSGRRRH
ncbi:hypothetical protein M9H77_29054 [Catharanthus roseus]|uniref:Uncharacterized protein n=1 Tax=Catharanthus roseus TaxID=4058 RepID=A0ACC0AI34_CATRO|nr:hypothetical protein M9H77_29054 [Catharanthus roseus]